MITFEWKGTDADPPLLLKVLIDDGIHVQSWKEVETTSAREAGELT